MGRFFLASAGNCLSERVEDGAVDVDGDWDRDEAPEPEPSAGNALLERMVLAFDSARAWADGGWDGGCDSGRSRYDG